MKIYMSLFVNNNYFKKTNTDMWKLSVALVKKHYDSVHLITDDAGAKYLESIPFDSVHRELNFVPKFDAVWSVGKIYAYKYICSLGEPFLHMDGDVFLWEPLPEDLLQSNIFCESDVLYNIGQGCYNYDLIPDTYPTPKIWLSNRGINTYGLGIIGGSDLLNIEKYCNFAIDMINNPKYYDLWHFNRLSSIISTLVEQGNFAIFCKENNIIPNTFYNLANKNLKTYKKYTHLITKKTNSDLINKIHERVSSVPMNLTPRDVSIENWTS